MKKHIDKGASLSSIIAASACPACFPALAGLSSALGLTFLYQYERELIGLFKVLVIISYVAILYGYKSHKNRLTLISATTSIILIFGSFYGVIPYFFLIYVGMGLLFVSSLLNSYFSKKCKACLK